MSEKISAVLIKELREKTNAPIMDCKRALVETKGNLAKAEDALRRKGLLIAAKRQGRETLEGVIASYIHFGGKIGVLVEVNCETDFVARSEEFKSLVKDITMHIAASNPTYISADDISPKVLEKEKDFYCSQFKDKPPKVADKIVEGKLQKFFSEVCLLNQPFIRDPDVSIGAHLNSFIGKLGENVRVRRFIRYQVGEKTA